MFSNMSAALTNRKYFKSLLVRKQRVSGKEQERTLLRKYFKSPIINRSRFKRGGEEELILK